MDIDKALTRMAKAPLEQIDLSHIESGVMRSLSRTRKVVKSQIPIRLGAMAAAMFVGASLGSVASAQHESSQTLVSGAHLAPSALLAFRS